MAGAPWTHGANANAKRGTLTAPTARFTNGPPARLQLSVFGSTRHECTPGAAESKIRQPEVNLQRLRVRRDPFCDPNRDGARRNFEPRSTVRGSGFPDERYNLSD